MNEGVYPSAFLNSKLDEQMEKKRLARLALKQAAKKGIKVADPEDEKQDTLKRRSKDGSNVYAEETIHNLQSTLDEVNEEKKALNEQLEELNSKFEELEAKKEDLEAQLADKDMICSILDT